MQCRQWNIPGQYWLLLDRLIDTWSSYHPLTLLTDFDSLPSDVGESAIKEVVSAIARSSPQEAAEKLYLQWKI